MINSYNILIAHNRGNRPKTFAAALVVFLRMETHFNFIKWNIKINALKILNEKFIIKEPK